VELSDRAPDIEPDALCHLVQLHHSVSMALREGQLAQHSGRSALVRRELIRRHHRERPGPQQALAVDDATVDEQTGKREVVVERGP
jgi:hypothetical protein